ncbi:phage tail length tape measure family protein [Rhizobium sp. NFR12]|uniref:phage tail length tape measure family protein n=1 Tax=Rhizobium sp. NFR12 TaxID=1566261 RepID=UPI0008A74464|nr:phage tail length tape measure family protein [Rhizobium sp. NFR12]SEH22525.1 Prophage tail length tape measure protein [Rhizobium sp. NFR12]
MANPLKISARVEIDPSQARHGATAASSAIAGIGDAAGKSATELQKLIATSTGLHDGPANQNAREWTGALAAQGKSLDDLRAKWNPLFGVIRQYKASLTEIRTLHAQGALSADEMASAISRERQAALASIEALKGRNAAIADTPAHRGNGSQSFNTSNLAAQGFDIASTAAFMPWYTVALQQGPQVSQVFNDIRASGQSIGPAVAGAFTQILNPVSLVTIGVIAATAALVQYLSSASEVKTADELLKGHAETIASLRERYGQAASGLREYVNEGLSGTIVDIRDRLKDARESIVEAASARSTYSTFITPFVGSTDAKIVSDYQNAFIELRASIKAGEPDLLAFRDAMARIADNANAPKGVRDLAEEMRKFDDDVVRVARSIPGMNQQIGLIEGTATAQIGAVSQLSSALRELAGIAMPALTDQERALRAYQTALQADPNSRSAQREYDEALLRIWNQNPTVTNSDGNTTNVPIPGAKPITLGDKPAKPDKSVAATANAYRDLVKSADDRVAQMKLEAQLAGETGVAAETLRFKLDILQQSEDKGRKLTPQQVEAINARVEAFKKYAEEAAKATLKADILFEREQLGRSAMDQQIASSLKGAGLPVDFDSYEAGLIRTNLQLQYARELTGDFVSTFASGISQGKGMWETLGDAAVSVLKRISETLLNDVLNSLFQVNSAAAGGGSGGGLLGSLLGGFTSLFGGSSAFPAKPGGSLYDRGGYTGPGGVHEPRGIVHAGEIVWSQADIARAGGVQTVDAMRLGRRGYDRGGIVGVQPLLSAGASGQAGAGIAASRGMISLKVGLDLDNNGNLKPLIKQVVADEAPGYAIEIVRDYDAGMPDRVAAINSEPWRR